MIVEIPQPPVIESLKRNKQAVKRIVLKKSEIESVL
jgi:hypothetical protein